MADIRTIGVLAYENCSEQDTITPLEIFRGAAMALDQRLKILPPDGPPTKLDVKLVSVAKGNVRMQMGTEVVPDELLDDRQSFDIFFVPGGVGAGAMTRNDNVLAAIRRHYQSGKIVASNCSGVGVLCRAGILGQTPVTCVAAIARRLRELGANVPQPRMMWQGVPDARIWTATGSYGVHGGAAAIVAHYFGRTVVTTIGMMFDTLGGLGETLYKTVGPEFFYHPDLEKTFQDFWEDQLLPK